MKKISILMVLVIMSTLLFSGCGKEYVEGTKLRTDGVYQSKLKDSNGECSYICFYEDGKAATVSDDSVDSPEKAYEAFHDGSIICNHSTSFQTSGGVIVREDQGGKTVKMAPTCIFTIQVNTGTTTYTCYLRGNVLECDIVNPIRTTNNKKYEFIPID
ncbi:MAG: hypothetical protein J6W35_00415 [Eubacterium sp.]|nr:hypothetical protein [Eubacterium sp.]